MLTIKLLPSTAQETAKKILAGELPPEINDYEVLSELLGQATTQGIEIECFREKDNQSVCFDAEMLQVVLEQNIEIRPLSSS